MSILLSVDPGIRVAGCALWKDGALIACALVRNTAIEGAGPRECSAMARVILHWVIQRCSVADALVVEWPQTYGGRASRGDTNDLLPLAGVDAALADHFDGVSHYTPHSWKGSISKPKRAADPYAIDRRIRRCLNDAEYNVYDREVSVLSAKHSWDVADGVGVGLHHLGRFGARRVFPRE